MHAGLTKRVDELVEMGWQPVTTTETTVSLVGRRRWCNSLCRPATSDRRPAIGDWWRVTGIRQQATISSSTVTVTVTATDPTAIPCRMPRHRCREDA